MAELMRIAIRQLIETNAHLESSSYPPEVLYIADTLVDYFLKGYIMICYRYELEFSVSPTLKEVPFEVRAFFKITDKGIRDRRYPFYTWYDFIKDLPGMRK